jgi:hypothetical protein
LGGRVDVGVFREYSDLAPHQHSMGRIGGRILEVADLIVEMEGEVEGVEQTSASAGSKAQFQHLAILAAVVFLVRIELGAEV